MLSKMLIAAAVLSMALGAAGMVDGAQAAPKKESYPACKSRVSKEPPCNSTWTKACAAQCGAKY
jgi:hypothetical protein